MQDQLPAKTALVVSGGAVAAERKGELCGVSSPSVRLGSNGYAF